MDPSSSAQSPFAASSTPGSPQVGQLGLLSRSRTTTGHASPQLSNQAATAAAAARHPQSPFAQSLLSGIGGGQQQGQQQSPQQQRNQQQQPPQSQSHQQQQQPYPGFPAQALLGSPAGVGATGPAALAHVNAQLSNYMASQQQQQQQQQQQTNMQQSSSGESNTQSDGTGSSIHSNNAANNPAAFYATSSSQLPNNNANQGNNYAMTSPSTPSAGGAAAFAPQLSQLPPGMSDFSALNIHSTNSSAPASAASSPGWTHRRLPSGSHHVVGGGSGTPGSSHHGHPHPHGSHAHPHPHPTHTHNPRVAASSITGKRLNWGEMICATIANSEHGRLVIQDLFEQMCQRFPEVQEWAFGKDWEARVKNRIKSTLSIKGHLFIKVPRPSHAAGKGSWWTLSQEAQDAYRENRLAPLLKMSGTGPSSATHSRSGSRNDSLSMSAVTSAAPSRYNSPGPNAVSSATATPIKQHSQPHPLAQHIEAGTLAESSGHQAQAQHAAQLAQLQAQLLQQQQAQREALPGSYDPNAPPSAAAANYYSLEGLGFPQGLPSQFQQQQQQQGQQGQQQGQQQHNAQGLADGSDGFFNTLQQMYGTSFGNSAQNPGAIPMPGKSMYAGAGGGGDDSTMSSSLNMGLGMSLDLDPDKMGALGGPGSGFGVGGPGGPGDPHIGSFESGSFGATLRALGANAPGSGWRGMRASDPSISDSMDSASASSTSGPTTVGTGSASSASSYGIGSPQSVPHLGGPQSMPFPPNRRLSNNNGHGGAGPGNASHLAHGNAHGAPTGSAMLGDPFDLNSGPGGPGAVVSGPPGPGGMYPYPSSALGGNAGGDNAGPGGMGGVGGPGAKMEAPTDNHGLPFWNGFYPPGHHHGQPASHNPFGVSLPGGYAMPGGGAGVPGGHPAPNRPGGGAGIDSSSAGGTVPPSPADSTSAFFAYTPAAAPVDGGGGGSSREGSEAGDRSAGADSAEMGGGESALGPLVGSKRRSSAHGAGAGAGTGVNGGTTNGSEAKHHVHLAKVEEGFALPPPASASAAEGDGVGTAAGNTAVPEQEAGR